MVMVTKIHETASINFTQVALGKGRKMFRLQGTSIQHSAAALFLFAALSCKSKKDQIRQTFPGYNITSTKPQTDFSAASLTDDGLRSELLSTRRRLAVAMNILIERKNQENLVGR
jgi:hypothetical protein